MILYLAMLSFYHAIIFLGIARLDIKSQSQEKSQTIGH